MDASDLTTTLLNDQLRFETLLRIPKPYDVLLLWTVDPTLISDISIAGCWYMSW